MAILLIKFLKFRSKFGWLLSNSVALLRWNLFTYRDLWQWIDNPVETLPRIPIPDHFQLPLFGSRQQLLVNYKRDLESEDFETVTICFLKSLKPQFQFTLDSNDII